MIVKCDKCGAKFQLADGKVSEKGAKVRCSKCKNVFVVKKEQEEPDSYRPPGPPPSEKQAPPPPQGQQEEDPFSDFSFSDDLDFGEEEDFKVEPSKGPPPEKEEPELMDDNPPAPVPDDSSQDEQPPSDEEFDFADEEFSFADEAESAPAPQAEPPKPPSPPPQQEPPDQAGADEFGAFDFDDEGLQEPAPEDSQQGAPADGPAPGEVEEFGNLSLDADDQAAPAAKDEGFDEAGFGDFQFDADDRLSSSGDKEEEGMGLDVDDFVRAPDSKAPVRDDLEASIGESEAEAEPGPGVAPTEPPPKPVIKVETEKRSKTWLWPLVLVLVLAGGLFGGVAYTNSQGWFAFGDLFSGKFKKACDIPALTGFCQSRGWKAVEPAGEVEVAEEFKHQIISRNDGLLLIAVTGEVVNDTEKPQSGIMVEAYLKDKNTDEVIARGASYCGISFTKQELETMSIDWIKDTITTSSGRDFGCLQVPPGESRSFAIVFFLEEIPSEIKLVSPKVVEHNTAG